MKTAVYPLCVFKHRLAYRLGDNVWRADTHQIVIVDEESQKALVVYPSRPKKEKEENEH